MEKHFPRKHEDLISDPQHSDGKLGKQDLKPNTQETEAGRPQSSLAFQPDWKGQ